MKRSVALTLVALAAGGAVSLSAAGAAQAAPSFEATKSVAAAHQDRDRDRDRDRHDGWGWDRDRHDGWGDGWNHKRANWQYAGSYRSKRACERVAWLGERSDHWDDSKCVGGGWGVKLFVKKHRWS
ncbi:hypothetical protein J2S43_005820 [Catenuloplanes nepalensis]|uniref:Secreted protein n=1 Tax=Catenuloplanes nepalensis TaxID=587533 RepID=A0ABT9N0U5_9ACTN|nr:hypothetical protein [Catenuloplanes nepalensis]MDP9797308.1 hypothetical protein [Catenuloplanes nepalensis]